MTQTTPDADDADGRFGAYLRRLDALIESGRVRDADPFPPKPHDGDTTSREATSVQQTVGDTMTATPQPRQTPRFIAPVREASSMTGDGKDKRRRIFTTEHLHGTARHSHPHLHMDDGTAAGCDGYGGSAMEHSDHTHCRTCGSDDRLCEHRTRAKGG